MVGPAPSEHAPDQVAEGYEDEHGGQNHEDEVQLDALRLRQRQRVVPRDQPRACMPHCSQREELIRQLRSSEARPDHQRNVCRTRCIGRCIGYPAHARSRVQARGHYVAVLCMQLCGSLP